MKYIDDIEKHLVSRGLDPERTQVIIDKAANVATFLLYNLSGQLIGYQEYNPSEEKTRSNAGRYFTYISKVEKTPKLAVWGTETIDNSKELFVVEGVFDAIKLHNAGKSAIAVLGNNPKILNSWLGILPQKKIAIIDNDAAGTKLTKYVDEFYKVPDDVKDLGDMTQEQVNNFMGEIGYPVDHSDLSKEQLVLTALAELTRGTEFEGKVFLAGGAVRDELMGSPVKDIDLVVSMPDGGIKFAEWLTKRTNTYKQGSNPVVYEKFGTAKFNLSGISMSGINLSDVDIEVVMTRGEKYEKGSRKPEVVYSDLMDDAYRRDLTVNSLFKDIVSGEVFDLTGMGMSDIQRGIVRTPTDPDVTFADDPLRMLRAVRFAVKYNWKMSKRVLSALQKNADTLPQISQERIRDELNKILLTDNPDIGLKILHKTGLLKHILPELEDCFGVKQNEFHKHDVFEHILEVVKNSPKNLIARLSALFHDIGKPVTKTIGNDGRIHFYGHEDVGAVLTEKIMKRLKYPNEEISSVQNIVKNHMKLKQTGKDGSRATDKQLRKFVNVIGDDLDTALGVMHADNISHKDVASMPTQIDNIRKRISKLVTQTPSTKVNLPINGNDVMRHLGIQPGPAIKQLLSSVEDAWFEDPELSKEDALKLVGNEFKKIIIQNKKNIPDTIINPLTKNRIKSSTALGYSKDHPARQALMRIILKQ